MVTAPAVPDVLMRFALGLSYDGTAYRGWQTQPGGQTVQDTFQQALKAFLGHPAVAVCAGRTDAGVHALQQVVHVDTSARRSPESWVRGLNSWLPDTIRVQWAHPVTDAFHARFSAQARSYVYLLRNHRVASPFLAHQAGWAYRPLSVGPMRQAAAHLLGKHDFSCFRSSQCQASGPVRTLHQLDIIEQSPYLIFVFRADAFLHHMVRNIMGALVYVGQGRQAPDWIPHLLQQRDRRLAAPTFSPKGLYLADVHYPSDHGLPRQHWACRLHQLTAISVLPPGYKGMS